MNRIETNRAFLVRPKGFLYYNANPDCNHRNSPWLSNCPDCRGVLGDAEFVGTRSVFENDGLTIGRLAGVYYRDLFVGADLFIVLEEVTPYAQQTQGKED